jgi:CheY-like chemotaxis protein
LVVADLPKRQIEVGKVARSRILLADDHRDARKYRAARTEFSCWGGRDGYALLEAVKKMKPDVCVPEISMPIVSGIEAATRLRAAGSDVRIVFLTVHEDLTLQAALDTGAWLCGQVPWPRTYPRN